MIGDKNILIYRELASSMQPDIFYGESGKLDLTA